MLILSWNCPPCFLALFYSSCLPHADDTTLRSWPLVPSFHGKQRGKKWKNWHILFSWTSRSLHTVAAAIKLKDTCSLEGKLRQTQQYIKKQRHNFADKGPYGQGCGFPVVMYGCESRTIKKAEHKELMLLNCGTEEASWESLRLQGDQSSQS